MQYAPIMERALSEMKSLGLRGAAEFLLIAAPAARFSLGEEWRQALERIGGHAQTNDPADGI